MPDPQPQPDKPIKAAGTGVFMPLTMRTVSNSGNNSVHVRSKPNRHRNLSSPNIQLSCHEGEPNRCSNSSSSSNARRRNPPISRRSFTSVGRSIEEDQAADYTPIAGVAVAMHAAANVTASAFPAATINEHAAAVAAALRSTCQPIVPNATTQQRSAPQMSSSPPGLSDVMQLQPQPDYGYVQAPQPHKQTQDMLAQYMSPGQLTLLGNSTSRNASPRTSLSDDAGSSITAPNAVRFGTAAPSVGPGQGTTAAARYSPPISSDTLQTFYGIDALPSAPAGAPGTADALPSVNSSHDVAGLVIQAQHSSSNIPATQDVHAAAPAVGSSMPGHSMHVVSQGLPATPALPADGQQQVSVGQIYSQLSFAKWAGPQAPISLPMINNMSDNATLDVTGADLGLEQHEENIEKQIEELLVMKQLLQLKQQHQRQQQLLQLQQRQQEQALRQQLAKFQRSNGERQSLDLQLRSKSWTAGPSAADGVGRSRGSGTMQQLLQQQQALQVQQSAGSAGSADQMHHQMLQYQLQQQQQLQVDCSGAGFTNKGCLNADMQQALLQQLSLENKISDAVASQDMQQLRELQQQQSTMQQAILTSNGLLNAKYDMLAGSHSMDSMMPVFIGNNSFDGYNNSYEGLAPPFTLGQGSSSAMSAVGVGPTSGFANISLSLPADGASLALPSFGSSGSDCANGGSFNNGGSSMTSFAGTTAAGVSRRSVDDCRKSFEASIAAAHFSGGTGGSCQNGNSNFQLF